MSPSFKQIPDIPENELEHVDLWKYFESRGSGVKDTMFKVVTWLVGFATVIMGFIIKETLTLKADVLVVDKPFTLLLLSLAGLIVVVYARVLIGEFSDHINRNFDRADRARDTSNSLLVILDLDDKDPNRATGMPNICKYVLRVVWVFGAIFLLGVFFATIKLLMCT